MANQEEVSYVAPLLIGDSWEYEDVVVFVPNYLPASYDLLPVEVADQFVSALKKAGVQITKTLEKDLPGLEHAENELVAWVEQWPAAPEPWPVFVGFGGRDEDRLVIAEFYPCGFLDRVEEITRREWYGDLTPEEAEAAYQEDLEIRRKDRTETRRRCLHESACADEYSFDWRERVPDERKSEKCVGRCLCEEFKNRVVTIECEFSLHEDGTPAVLTFLPRTDL